MDDELTEQDLDDFWDVIYAMVFILAAAMASIAPARAESWQCDGSGVCTCDVGKCDVCAVIDAAGDAAVEYHEAGVAALARSLELQKHGDVAGYLRYDRVFIDNELLSKEAIGFGEGLSFANPRCRG
jgi:hypothetical protein